MEQYIKKSDIVAEIERRMKEHHSGYLVCLKDILSFLDTLEVKGINNVWNNASDFPKAEAGRSILLIEDNGRAELLKSPSAERLFHFRHANLKMWAYVDELLSITTPFEVKEVKEPTNFDRVIAEGIILYLLRLGKEYHIDMEREIEWLKNKIQE